MLRPNRCFLMSFSLLQGDYKLILKFDDVQSLTGYMEDHHSAIMEEFTPKIKELIIGDLHQQNFVYDDIDE